MCHNQVFEVQIFVNVYTIRVNRNDTVYT